MKTLTTALLIAAALVLSSSPPLSAQDVWEPLSTGTAQDLFAVHFVNADVGYAAGATGTVIKTTDGGVTWDDVSPGVSDDLYDVHFFDADTGVAVGGGGTIVRTTDGGTSWTTIPSGVSDPLYSVSFAGTVGLAGGGSQAILRSDDQGATWTVVQSGFFGGGFYGADMLSDDLGAVVGENSIFQPLVAYTTDGGATFDFAFFYLDSNEGWLNDVHFLDEMAAVSAATTWFGGGAIARSVDGAATWTATLYDAPLEAVDFADGALGYAAGWEGTLLKTTDGGQNWEPVSSGSTATLYGLSLPTTTTGYVVGSAGTALKGAITTGTPVEDGPASPRFVLEPNAPNPFRARTALRYRLPEGAHVTLRVYDALGQEVAVLVDGHRAPGRHEVEFDGSRLSAGTYLCVLEAGGSKATRTMLLLK